MLASFVVLLKVMVGVVYAENESSAFFETAACMFDRTATALTPVEPFSGVKVVVYL